MKQSATGNRSSEGRVENAALKFEGTTPACGPAQPPPKNLVFSVKKPTLPVDIAAVAASTEELPCPAEVVPLVLDGVPSLPPAVIYAAGIMEPPPRDLLTVKGWGGVPMARIEVPHFGPCMAAMALGAGPLGVLMLMHRPPDDEAATIPHPAFLPDPDAWTRKQAGH